MPSDPRVSELDSRLTRLTQSLIAIQSELAVVKTEIDVIRKLMTAEASSDVLQQLKQLEERQGHITRTLISVQTELNAVRSEVDKLRPAAAVKTEAAPAPVKTTTTTPPPVIPAPKPAAPPKPKRNIEEFIGGNVINKIGIVILVIGFTILLKYAIDNDWINEITRVVIGLVSGAVVLGFAFKLRARYNAFSAVLLSGGMAILYFSVYAAYDFYDLIPQEMAFVLLFLLTAFTVFAAVMYDRQVIGVIGLVGAYAVPFLVSENEGRVAILLTYMTVINTGILILAFRKNWVWLNYLAFSFSWLIFLVWYADRFDFDRHAVLASSFATIFFLMFYLMILAYKLRKREMFHIKDIIILSLNSFFFFSVGMDVTDRISDGVYQGLFTALTAVIHFPFAYLSFRAGLADRRFFYLQIGLVLTFLSLAIPIQLDGPWVTIIWSIEAAILFAIGRTLRAVFYERIAYALIVVGVISLLEDWSTHYDRATDEGWIVFLNTYFYTSIVSALSLGIVAWLHFVKKYFYEAVSPSRFSWICGLITCGLFVVVLYFSFFQEIALLFDTWTRRSAVTADFTYYDASWGHYQTVWLLNYTYVFLICGMMFILKKTHTPALSWTAFVIVLLTLLVFLTSGLDALAKLRTDYLDGSPYFHYSVFHVVIRYIAVGLTALALTVLYRISSVLPLRPYYALGVHTIAIILVSSELSNLVALLNPTDYRDAEYYTARVGYTILWGVYSMGLIVYGIWRRHKLVRFYAIGLFGVTLLKLYLIDLADISTSGKIISFIALGLLLLIISFMYQKFKHVLFAEDSHA
jgi:uncharacterized membrane protein